MQNHHDHSSDTGYTVAVLADIHGNLEALEAVLADLAGQHYDTLVIAGDLVMNGPQPMETLVRVRQLQVPTIFGNTDRDVVEAGSGPSIAHWTAEQIGKEGLAYLDDLHFAHFVSLPTGPSPVTDLLIVHATPTSVYDVLVLEDHPLRLMSKVTPEVEAKRMLGDAQANLIIYGHIHYASTGMVGAQRLVSIGAVGFPFDGDRRAAYALVSWDGRNWQVIHRRVMYDYNRTIAALQRSGQPLAERSIEMLRKAGWVPAN